MPNTLTAITYMTQAEFEALPDDVRFCYPSRERSWNPSHSNYWMCEILHHVSNGGTLPRRVWKSLTSQEQSTIIFHCGAWHTNKPPVEG